DAPGCLVVLLAVDRKRVWAAAVGADKARALDEEAAGPARRVEHAPLERLQHLDQKASHGGRRVELAAAMALRAGERLDEVLVDAAQQVARALRVLAKPDVRDRAEQLAEGLGCDGRATVDPRQHASELRVLSLDRLESSVNPGTDVGLGCRAEEFV